MIIKALSSGSKGNAYYISDGETRLLIECGVSRRRLERNTEFSMETLSGVLVSHKHGDHCKSIEFCINAGAEVYAPADVFVSKNVEGPQCHKVKPFKGFAVGSFFIVPFDLQHDCINYGYLLCSRKTGERLLYFSDTYMVKYQFDGLTHIMAECNYSIELLRRNCELGVVPGWLKDRIQVSHMSVDNLLAFLKANNLEKVEEIYLIHLSEVNGNAKVFRHRIKKATGKKVMVMA